MRWKRYYPKEGDTRIVKRFLWTPTELQHEVRWLEKARIKQCYTHFMNESFDWEDIEWV